jgi:hypothetical protein
MAVRRDILQNRLVKWLCFLLFALSCGRGGLAFAAQVAAVSDYKSLAGAPNVWVVNIPNENASLDVADKLTLHYHFTGAGQYLGVIVPLKLQARIHKVSVRVQGDHSGCGLGLYVIDVSGETHKYHQGSIDFDDWKTITVDLDAPHETWGGDKNGKIDPPIQSLIFEISTPGHDVNSHLTFGDISVDSAGSADDLFGRTILVNSPEYCSTVHGDTTVNVNGRGFRSLTVHCWKQGGESGSDSIVSKVALDAKGDGSFVFPADAYPHGPVTLTLSGKAGDAKDNCYLQLYNSGGVSWNEGIPKTPPPAANDMKLVFADDFDGPLSIGEKDSDTYYDHKPPGGTQDFSSIPFTSFDRPNNPFKQIDTYLRIRINAAQHSSGLISSLHSDGKGIEVPVPCYFECRFIAPNAPGTWPAFWLMTDNAVTGTGSCDELDILEGYGGEGPGEPNAYSLFMITPHPWNYPPGQAEIYKAMLDKQWPYPHPCDMYQFGIPSTWYETFHTYGCKVTETRTTYYCDNIELGHHDTLMNCKKYPLFFMVNLATGGGWPVDLSRYHGLADMYVDFIRVYQGNK